MISKLTASQTQIPKVLGSFGALAALQQCTERLLLTFSAERTLVPDTFCAFVSINCNVHFLNAVASVNLHACVLKQKERQQQSLPP